MIAGFGSLGEGSPFGDARRGLPKPVGPDQGSVGIRPVQKTGGGPTTYSGAPAMATAPASPAPMPYGQAKDPAAYGSPGAPGSSPLGMWQSWLNTMGPYLAQMPSSEPMAESGGLSSLSPSSGSPGSLRGYSGPDTPWQGQRGFRMLDR